MHIESGRVIELKSETAVVVLAPSDYCTGCDAKNLCQMGSRGERILEVKNTVGAKVGDEVVITIQSRYALTALFLIFGLPVILGSAGVVFTQRFSNNNLMAICGLAGIALGLAIAKIFDRALALKRKALPEIVEIRKNSNQSTDRKSVV